ncbi:hypothetical protein ACFXO9_34415, partial [Nocardia tengchongensis]|uniref:hypothetical protein n=1 Tax=Nocardia tengchongensis TaxID=2055889 RepID=UPI00367B75E0
MVSVEAFNTTVQDKHPLSKYLDDLVAQLGLNKRLQQLGELTELDDFESAFADELAAGRPALPTVGELERARIVHDIQRPTSEDGQQSETISRHYFCLPIQGDERLLMRWPDRDETGLIPVDAETWEKYYDTCSQNRLHNYLFRVGCETWVLSRAIVKTCGSRSPFGRFLGCLVGAFELAVVGPGGGPPPPR